MRISMVQHGGLIGVVLAVVFGGWLRLSCLSSEFWLDEIWSWQLAQKVDWPWDVFRLRIDNNHHLNTLWIALWPAGTHATFYRLHVFVAGLLGIVATARLGRRLGTSEAVFAAWFHAGSFWLVDQATQARGYALAVLFALLAFDSLWSYLESSTWRSLIAFWLCIVLGFLAHLSFAIPGVALAFWSLYCYQTMPRTSATDVRRLLVCFGLPITLLLPFFLFSVRGMALGGGPVRSTFEVVSSLVSVGVGGPSKGWLVLPSLLVAASLIVAGVRQMSGKKSKLDIFFAMSVVGVPLLFLIRPPAFLFERYLLLSFVYALLLIGLLLGGWWRRGGVMRMLAALLLVGFLAGNVKHVRELAVSGRGEFRQALAWILSKDPSPKVIVTGDHDFRVGLYVDYYGPRLAVERQVVYASVKEIQATAARWLLVHSPDESLPIGQEMKKINGQSYRLAWQHPPNPWPVNWGWSVYDREVSNGDQQKH